MDNALRRLLNFLFVDGGSITLVTVLGLAAVALLLPRPRPSGRRVGAALGTLAIALTGVLLLKTGRVTAEVLLFYAFSAIAVTAGGLLVTQSHPARAALSFALVVLSTCGLFLLKAAPFLMAATVIIYAGAIVVTFLFVLMLAQQEGPSDADQRSREPVLAPVTGFLLLAALLYMLQTSYGTAGLDRALVQLNQARSQDSLPGMVDVLGDGTEQSPGFFDGFAKLILKGGDTREARQLAGAEVTNLRFAWQDAVQGDRYAEAQQVCARLEEVARRARAGLGQFQPPADVPLSNQSGPPANTPQFGPLDDQAAGLPPGGAVAAAPPGGVIRRHPSGNPEMPHENTAYLGRSLFTDYLLAVELAGTLLLVATVGAIAIAGRRDPALDDRLALRHTDRDADREEAAP